MGDGIHTRMPTNLVLKMLLRSDTKQKNNNNTVMLNNTLYVFDLDVTVC